MNPSRQHSSRVPEAPTDVVDSCEIAGVTLTWLRERHATEAGHRVMLVPTEPGESIERHGPFARRQAKLVYESMRAALLAAARQQNARLRRVIAERRAVAIAS